MAFLFDFATFIAGTLILLMATITLRQNDEAGTISNRRVAAATTANLGMMIRMDFENVAGFQSHTDSTIVLTVTDDPVAGTQTTVSYERLTAPDGEFSVRRTVAGVSPITVPGLSGWSTTLLDETGTPTTDLVAARQTTIRFTLSPAFAVRTDTLHAVWEHTFSPPLLRGIQF